MTIDPIKCDEVFGNFGDYLPPDPKNRPQIKQTTDEYEAIEQSLLAIGKHSEVYQRGGKLVHITSVSESRTIERKGAPVIQSVSRALLRTWLTEVGAFYTYNKTEEGWRPSHPQDWLVDGIHARGGYPETIRPLKAIVDNPYLRPDGSVCTESGYDSTLGIYCTNITSLTLSEAPTQDDARRGLAALLDLIDDFPFIAPTDRAVWITFVLTLLSRFAFVGPAPMFFFDASTRGTGKGLLVDAASQIVFGREIPCMPPTDEESEMRKRITSIALAGDRVILFDNVVGTFGGAAIDAALTAVVWQDRKLGVSENVSLPLYTVWSATGNNVQFRGDFVRRVLLSRMISELERPETRDDFKYSKLLDHITANRKALLEAAFTILRAYYLAGKPNLKLTRFGKFEGWSDLVRGAVVWAGGADPFETKAEAEKRDPSTELVPAMLRAIKALCDEELKKKSLTAKDILRLYWIGQHPCENAKNNTCAAETLREVIEELSPGRVDGTLPNAKQLGRLFDKHRDRNFGGFVLTHHISAGNRRWYVKAAPTAATPPAKNGAAEISPEALRELESTRGLIEKFKHLKGSEHHGQA